MHTLTLITGHYAANDFGNGTRYAISWLFQYFYVALLLMVGGNYIAALHVYYLGRVCAH